MLSATSRYRSRNCTNPSVCQRNRDGSGIFLIPNPFILGLYQGGEFVTARATAAVQGAFSHPSYKRLNHSTYSGMLKGSRLDTTENLETFSQKFDAGVKKAFSESQRIQYHVKFCSLRDTDTCSGIKAGKIVLTRSMWCHFTNEYHSNFQAYSAQVSSFFEPSIQSIADSIAGSPGERLALGSVRKACISETPLLTTRGQFAFLVGGFGSSPWLSEQLQKRLSHLGLQFCRPDYT